MRTRSQLRRSLLSFALVSPALLCQGSATVTCIGVLPPDVATAQFNYGSTFGGLGDPLAMNVSDSSNCGYGQSAGNGGAGGEAEPKEWYGPWKMMGFVGGWQPLPGKWHPVGKLRLGRVIPGSSATATVIVACRHVVEQQNGIQLGTDWAKLISEDKKVTEWSFSYTLTAAAHTDYDIEYLIICEADHRSIYYKQNVMNFWGSVIRENIVWATVEVTNNSRIGHKQCVM